MASALLITYDLKEPEHEAALLKHLEEIGATRVTKSSYALSTSTTPEDIVKAIKKIAVEIEVYVFTISNPSLGYGPTPVNEYLQKLLPP